MRRHLFARTVPLLAVLVVALVPSSTAQPATMRLVDVQGVSSVDTGVDGVTWVLLLGSDASGTVPLEDGQTDAIQLLGLHPSGAAAAIGIPRDTLVDLGGERGRIDAHWTWVARVSPPRSSRNSSASLPTTCWSPVPRATWAWPTWWATWR